ncbi:MAG: amidohydrolase [Thiotrichales bacterium]|nr:amidohydrolase [Thiotrichales bacterium]
MQPTPGCYLDSGRGVTLGRLIDWHLHCYLPEHRSAADADLQRRRKVAGTGQASPQRLREVIDEAGVQQFVLVASPRREGVAVPHEFIAEQVAAYPGRAVGLASVNPAEPGAAEEFERAVTGLGLRGVKLSPTYQSIDPRSPACWEIYEIANAHHVPVMFHCGGAYSGSLEWADPCLLDKVAMAFPDLNLIVAHFGQPYMEQTAILMRKNENVFADLSARFHRPWQLYHGVMVAMEYRVTDRLLFGSDFPVRTPAEAMADFRGINDWGGGAAMPLIPAELIESIMYERPLSRLGLEP